jgi:deoxycytidylate deaminase
MRHIKWLQSALRSTKKSVFYPQKMCALVVKGGRVISVGLNRVSPGKLKDRRYHHVMVHAELDAILGVDPDDLKGATIYVAGVSKAGTAIKSEPCEACKQMLTDIGVRAVYSLEKDATIHKWIPAVNTRNFLKV